MVHPIDKFRTDRYRVFLAEPYFKIDLQDEINWHENYLKTLNKQKKDPRLFHMQRTSGPIEARHHRHFKEHVLDAIPFHEKILNTHKKRAETISSLIPDKSYSKIKKITEKTGTLPEYFIYDKENKCFFFAILNSNQDKENWSKLAKKKNVCEVVFLKK